MKINRKLFEDVLDGKLKGTFVLRNGILISSERLSPSVGSIKTDYPFFLGISVSENGEYLGKNNIHPFDVVDFISESIKIETEIPYKKEMDLETSVEQKKIVINITINL